MSLQNRLTKDLFLLGMSCIYLFAFASLYVQIPGLYGNNGLLPARLVLKDVPKSLNDLIKDQPSLLRFAPRMGLSVEHAMELFSLVGVAISFLCLIHRGCRDLTAFVIMWVLYFSLYQVGQTFLWFQWDILLLEAGFLTILVAPMGLRLWRWQMPRDNHHDNITMYLVKWLLFRLMFASGVVKLTSECPTWWGLTAMDWHYESQCIPTAMAWYFHQLPHWFQAFSTCMVYVIEIILPFLFFSPIKGLRIFSFYCQVLLMFLIMVTGNYNFFNLLTIVLNISLLDDDYLLSFSRDKRRSKRREGSRALGFIEHCITVVVYVALCWFTVKYFNLRVKPDYSGIDSKLGFTKTQFYKWLKWILPISIYIGAAGLAIAILRSLARAVTERTTMKKLRSVVGCLIMSAAAVAMFAISLVPHTVVSRDVQDTLWPSVKYYYQLVEPYEITHSYGLFRSMTGVGGRPEVVVEGSDRMNGGWKEYEFFYKPGNVSRQMPIVAPHQPRLDWQMWFAALGSYQHNHWFVNLAYRLLNNQPEVLALIEKNPFPNKPPKYIRASLYTYHYTKMGQKNKPSKDWWWREYKSEYLPALSVTEPTLTTYLKHVGILDEKKSYKPPPPSFVSGILDWFRAMLGNIDGCVLCMSFVTTAVVTNRLLRLLNV